jgi:hypothetical protein
VLTKEAKFLKLGGILYTHISPQTKIVDEHGNDVTVEWLNSIEGMKLVSRPKAHWELMRKPKRMWGMGYRDVALQRIGEVVRAPTLELIDVDVRHPPLRVYLWRRNASIKSSDLKRKSARRTREGQS